MRVDGTIYLKLLAHTHTHLKRHTFHDIGEPSGLHYDAILGKDFLEERESITNYCSRKILMDNEVVNFDPKPSANGQNIAD